jgi:uncharacterized protein involved in outer membrane biogenesis
MRKISILSRKRALLAWFALAALVYVAVIGVRIDASSFRNNAASLLSSKLGRAIRFDDTLQLEISLRPSLLIRQVHIAQPAGFGEGDFLQVGELRMALDLLPLLQSRLRAEELSGRDVRLLLKQKADGSNNWTFLPAASTPAPEPSKDEALSLQDAAHIDIHRIALTAVAVEYRGVNDKAQFFALDKLAASLPAEGAVTLMAEGTVDNFLPYQLAIKGGSLASLAAGRQPWPLEMKLDFSGGTLTVQGNLGAAGSTLKFGMGTPDLARFGRVLDMTLPDAGAAAAAGLLHVAPGSIALTELSGVLGKSVLTGQLAINLHNERPRISGALTLPSLDLRPFLGQDTQEEDAPADLRALYQSLARARFNLQTLNQFDADISLKVQQWLSLPGDIRDAALHVQLASGKLSLPLQATISGVPLKGEIAADASRSSPLFRIDFGAEKASIGDLAHLLTGLPGIEGKLGHLKLHLAAQGNQGQDLMESLSVKLDLAQSRLSYGNGGGNKPVAFTLDQFTLALPARRPLEGSLRGSLLGNAVDAVLRGGDLASSMKNGSTPVQFTARSKSVTAMIAGTLNANGNASQADLVFSVGAVRAGDVASWFGLRPDAAAPLALAGNISQSVHGWQLANLVFQLGRSQVYAELSQSRREGRAHLRAVVDAARIDSAELAALRPAALADNRQRKQGPALDVPILPQQLVLEDADISVKLRSVEGSPLRIADVAFDGQIRNGFMQTSPFHAAIAGNVFEGALMLDLREQVPHMQLWLSAANINAGSLLQELELAHGIEARLDHFGLYLDSRSSLLSGLIGQAQLHGQITGGKLLLRDANTASVLDITLRQGSLTAAPASPLTLELDGAIGAVPIALSVRSAAAKELIDPGKRVPFTIRAEAAQSILTLSGTAERDSAAQDLILKMAISGQRFDHLNPLLQVSLPPWGPWSAKGQLHMSRRGYDVSQIQLQVGSSLLNGQGALHTSSGQGKLDVALTAPLIQLEDFRTGSWSATDSKPVPADTAPDPEALRKKASATSDQVQSMLSPALLRQLNATVSVKVERVLSGRDQLGSGSLQARLKNGRAEIGPVSIDMPGGSATGSLGYEPGEHDVQANLKIDVDRFEYGVLARRIKAESDMSGKFSLHLDVASRAERLSDILRHGSGKLDFAVWPQNLSAGVFDMWAVNLLVALLPTLDPKNESTVNCAIGRFTLDSGKLRQRQFVIDTRQMRVTGNTAINFADEKITMRLQPQAKTSQFLSLATPLEVRGNFSDFSVGPNAGDVLATAFRMATSIIWVPIKKLFEDKVPADGSDVCIF